MYGLKEKHIKAINSVFSKYPQIEKTILYGSRAKDNYRNGSDIDFTLVGDDLDLSTLFKIETKLDDLLLPYKMDLSILRKIENPDLVDHIKRVGIVFYEKMMSEWKEVSLSNHIDLISGYAFKSKDFLETQIENTLPIIKIKNVANGDVNLEKVVYHKYDDSLSKFLLTKGDVLIAMTGNHPQAQTQVVGDVSKYKLSENSLLNQRVGKIVTKGKTDLDFIYYFFKDKDTHRYLANQSSGSANQANISKATIVGLKTELPEPIEQKQIAEILTSLDDKIDLLHRQNKTLEAMAETLFREWFVENAEESWEKGKLEDLLDIKYGKDHKHLKVGKIPVYGSGGIMRYVNQSLYTEETILIPRKGTLSNLFYLNGPFWSVDTMFYSKIIKKEYGKYCFLLLKTKNLASMNVGSAVPSLTTKLLNSISVIIPPLDIMKMFDAIIADKFVKINFNIYQIQTLEKLQDTLLPKLMSGEIKVVENE